MRCLRLSFKHISGCFLALLSLSLVGAYGAEDKPVGSPSGAKAMELKISPLGESSTLTSVKAPTSERQARKRRKAASVSQDNGAAGNNAAEAKEVSSAQALIEMEVDVFTELTDSPPVIFLSTDMKQCNFSVPWAGADNASVTVHSWNDETEEFDRKAMDGIDANCSINRGDKSTLTGSFDSSVLMNSSSSEFQIMVTNSNLEEGLFTKVVHVVVLGPQNINNIVLADGNAIDDALEKYSKYSSTPKKKGRPTKKGKSKKKSGPKQKLFIVASNPKKAHVIFQLPKTLAMTKEDVLRNAKLFEDTLKPEDEPMDTDDKEAQLKHEQWELLSAQLEALRVESEGEDEVDQAADEADIGILDWLKHKFSSSTDELAFHKGAEDAFVDPNMLHTVLGPVKTTNQDIQGISIEPWGDSGSDLANSRFIRINPAGKQLLVNLYGYHFPHSSKSYFKVKWIREAEQFATSHVMLTTPQVLNKPLMIFDLSARKLRSNGDISIEKVMQEITAINDISDAVVVVVGDPTHLPVIRRYLKDYTSLFFPQNDEPRLTYLKEVIKEFKSTKTVRKPFPGEAIFWETFLELDEIEFWLKPSDPPSAIMDRKRKMSRRGFKRSKVGGGYKEGANWFEAE